MTNRFFGSNGPAQEKNNVKIQQGPGGTIIATIGEGGNGIFGRSTFLADDGRTSVAVVDGRPVLIRDERDMPGGQLPPEIEDQLVAAVRSAKPVEQRPFAVVGGGEPSRTILAAVAAGAIAAVLAALAIAGWV